jgi:putative DNA primase/helicase
LVRGTDFSAQPAPLSWMVKGWVQDNALIMVHGPSGGGKTFVVLDWCLRIAAKANDWLGHKVRGGTVVYLAGEGHHGLRSRLAGWRQHTGMDLDNVWLSGSGCDLNTPEGYQKVVDSLEDLESQPRVIVVDTLHRFLLGDENSAQDAKTMLDACSKLMQDYNCSVILVHHTGVSDEAQHRARGSSAWRGALDIEVSVVPSKDNGPIEIVQRKSKDSEMVDPVYVELQSIDIDGWFDEDGAPVSSAILVAGAAPVKVSKADEKLKYAERAFQNMFALGGQIVVSGMPIVKYSAAETWFLQDGKAESTAKSYATNKLKAGVLNLLQDSKLIKKNELQGGWEPTSEDLKSRLLTGIVT